MTRTPGRAMAGTVPGPAAAPDRRCMSAARALAVSFRPPCSPAPAPAGGSVLALFRGGGHHPLALSKPSIIIGTYQPYHLK